MMEPAVIWISRSAEKKSVGELDNSIGQSSEKRTIENFDPVDRTVSIFPFFFILPCLLSDQILFRFVYLVSFFSSSKKLWFFPIYPQWVLLIICLRGKGRVNMDVDKNFLGSENWQFQVCRRKGMYVQGIIGTLVIDRCLYFVCLAMVR